MGCSTREGCALQAYVTLFCVAAAPKGCQHTLCRISKLPILHAYSYVLRACCLQAAQLLCSFREYHRRASFGLSAYYAQKLAAFEDTLLNAREALFSAQQQEEQLQEDQQLKVNGPAGLGIVGNLAPVGSCMCSKLSCTPTLVSADSTLQRTYAKLFRCHR